MIGAPPRLPLALLTALLLSSCAKPVPEDIVGTWEASSPDTPTSSAHCVTIVFSPDGDFEAYGYPPDFFGRYVQASFPASGEWTLDTSSDDPFAVHRVQLSFPPSEAFPVGLVNAELGITVDRIALLHGADTPEVFHRTDKPTCPQ